MLILMCCSFFGLNENNFPPPKRKNILKQNLAISAFEDDFMTKILWLL